MLRKNKLDSIEILISKTLIDWFIGHDEFVSINTVLREYNETRKKNKRNGNLLYPL